MTVSQSAMDQLNAVLDEIKSRRFIEGPSLRITDARPQSVDERILAVQKEQGLTYADAAEKVLSESPALYEKYKDLVLSKRAGMNGEED